MKKQKSQKPTQFVNLSLIQYELEGGLKVEAFFHKLTDYLKKCIKTTRENHVIVLPELFTLDMVPRNLSLRAEGKKLTTIARDVTPKILEFLADFSVVHKVQIISGGLPLYRRGKIVTNTGHFFDPKIVREQNKNFLTPDEKAYGFKSGNKNSKALKVIKTHWGTFAIAICFDSEYPKLSQQLAKQDLDVLFIPSLTSQKGFWRVRWCAQARAVEHHTYVAVTGVGERNIKNPEYASQAIVLSPQSENFSGKLKESPWNKSHVLEVTLDLDKLRKSQQETGYFPAKLQRV